MALIKQTNVKRKWTKSSRKNVDDNETESEVEKTHKILS